MKRRTLIALVSTGLLWASWGIAQVPPLIHYQGRLFRSTGEPEQGQVPFRFSLWRTAQDDGTPEDDLLWQEEHSAEASEAVLVENGFYEVELGRFQPIPAQIFSATEVYLEIQILPDPPMTPRQRILTVPFAFQADLLDGKHGSQYVSIAQLIAHASDPWGHPTRPIDASEIKSGLLNDARISGNIARSSDLLPFEQHLNRFDNPHRVTLQQAGVETSHDSLKGASGYLSHAAINAHILGLVASATTPLYDHACPADMVRVGYSCLDKKLYREVGQTSPLPATWFDAVLRCASKGKRLCRNSEWYVGCALKSTLGVSEIGTEKEWVDLWVTVGQDPLSPVTVGLGGCTANPIRENSPTVPMPFRCCR